MRFDAAMMFALTQQRIEALKRNERCAWRIALLSKLIQSQTSLGEHYIVVDIRWLVQQLSAWLDRVPSQVRSSCCFALSPTAQMMKVAPQVRELLKQLNIETSVTPDYNNVTVLVDGLSAVMSHFEFASSTDLLGTACSVIPCTMHWRDVFTTFKCAVDKVQALLPVEQQFENISI